MDQLPRKDWLPAACASIFWVLFRHNRPQPIRFFKGA